MKVFDIPLSLEIVFGKTGLIYGGRYQSKGCFPE
jgi:hypothetical protein